MRTEDSRRVLYGSAPADVASGTRPLPLVWWAAPPLTPLPVPCIALHRIPRSAPAPARDHPRHAGAAIRAEQLLRRGDAFREEVQRQDALHAALPASRLHRLSRPALLTKSRPRNRLP